VTVYRDGARVSPTVLGASPPGQCEHWCLLGNCPYCRIVELEAALRQATAGGGEVARLSLLIVALRAREAELEILVTEYETGQRTRRRRRARSP